MPCKLPHIVDKANEQRSVIAILRNALATDPENVELRVHLAALCLEAGEAQETLDHVLTVLQLEPDNIGALQYAAQAAELLGQDDKAAGYKRLLSALTKKEQGVRSTVKTDFEVADLDDFVDDEVSDDRSDQAAAPSSRDVVLSEADEIWDLEEPGFKLADVAGMEKVKERLHSAFLTPLKNPDLMKYFGNSLRGGLLLYGPPGCGKTFIARATAGELGAKFMAVGLPDVLDMWVGNSEKNLHEIFETARRRSPCVLFFDELDALGRKRSLLRHSAISGVVNQLLAEMDSLGNDNEGVFLLAATNHPWDVDTALRRPGRLDRMLLVLPPDQLAREGILRFHLRARPTADLKLNELARHTEGFSGADLAHLCESAAELAMEDSIRLNVPRPIQMGDFKQALKSVLPSTRAWFDTARNFALFANEGGLYDELLAYLKNHRLL